MCFIFKFMYTCIYVFYHLWCLCLAECRLPGLPYNLEKKTYCQLHTSCTSITCCTEDTELQTTISWFIHVDSCNLKLSIGIEEWKTELSLIDFRFGKFSEKYVSSLLNYFSWFVNSSLTTLIFLYRSKSDFSTCWSIQNQVGHSQHS